MFTTISKYYEEERRFPVDLSSACPKKTKRRPIIYKAY